MRTPIAAGRLSLVTEAAPWVAVLALPVIVAAAAQYIVLVVRVLSSAGA